MTDTSPAADARYRALLTGLTREQRLARALSLSALVRRLAWAGAAKEASDRGPQAVIERYLRQVYGPGVDVALRLIGLLPHDG